MKRYTAPVIWMGIMFILSTDIGSMEHTTSFLAPVFKFLFQGVSPEGLWAVSITSRKMAHLLEYAILAGLWFSAFNHEGKWIKRQAIFIALVISILYAGLDEIHQVFVLSRTGSILDVGLDSIGAALGLTVIKGRSYCLISSSSKKKAQYFGWWFAWGVFSTVMVLIVLKGSTLLFWQLLLITVAVGFTTGIGGLAYYARRN